MGNRRLLHSAITAIVALIVGGSPVVALSQEKSDDSKDDNETRQLAMKNEEGESATPAGLKAVDFEHRENETTSGGSADAESSTESADQRREQGEQGREQSSDDSKFEQLANSGRNAASSQEQSLGMDDTSSREGSGRSGSSRGQFDVQFGEKSVGEIIDLHRKQLVKCYLDRTSVQSSRSGKVTLKLVVEADGSVGSVGIAKSTLNHSPTESCMVEALRSVDFPPPKGGRRTTWTIPFQFGK